MKKQYISWGAFIALLMAACTVDGGNIVGPAGGFVFYDKGGYSAGWRYLECAPKNAGTETWERAKELCEEYRHGGYDDWELPDIDELKKLLEGKHGVGLFNNGVYWSSSEDGSYSAQGIQNGENAEPASNGHSSGKVQAPSTYSKSHDYWVRPIRRF
jgi:hypothetical protein